MCQDEQGIDNSELINAEHDEELGKREKDFKNLLKNDDDVNDLSDLLKSNKAVSDQIKNDGKYDTFIKDWC